MAQVLQARLAMTTRASTAGARGDPLVWIGLASSAGALLTVAAVPAILVVFALGGMLLLHLRARWTAALAIVALLLGFVRAHAAIARHERSRSSVAERGIWPSRCTLQARVRASPTYIGGGLRLELDADEVSCRDAVALEGRITLHFPVDDPNVLPAFARGDQVSATASLAPPYRFWNDGTGDPRPASARRGVVLSGGAEDVVLVHEGSGLAWAIDRERAHMRQRILATFPAETAAMARALVLGEDDLPEHDQRAFRRSGLAHLLAVSGMHLVLVVMGLVAAVRALLVRVPLIASSVDAMRIASALGLPIAWIYAELAGGSGSAIRAAWMCSVALLARALGRRTAAWRALGLSLVVMSVLDPLVVFDVSFVLSALATAGILALARPIEQGMKPYIGALPGFVVKPLSTTLAATVACAPILATMAPELPLGGLVANVLAVPLGEAAALPLCLVHGLLSTLPAAERGCAVAASGALALVRFVARAFTWGALPVPAPTPEQLAALVLAAAGAALSPVHLGAARRRRWLWPAFGAVALVALELVARTRGSPHGVVRVTFIDVGQGDAMLVDLPDGSAILVDGGGLVGSPIDVGERAVGPLLAARRRRELRAVVLSHPHPDHHLGLASALERVRPASFWDNGQGELEAAAGPYAELLASLRRRGVPLLRPVDLCGVHTIGGATIEVLAPCPSVVPDRGANDNSFVLRIRFGERAILLMGDAEREEEAGLVERLAASGGLRADVLKVGHHGSRTSSSPAFLAAVSPHLAVISCGVRNRFGHPHAQTLDALGRSGARVLRTDRDGGVIVTTDGRSLDVRTMGGR